MDAQRRHYEAKLAYEIDSWDLKTALDRGERLTVIDARSASAFAKEHIPGAISLPHRTMDEASTSPLDRSGTVVVYCDGIGCNASTKGALNMTNLGFRVKELMGGLDWWKRDGYPTEGASRPVASDPSCGCE